MSKKIYIVWVGGIWVSAIARYYLHQWWQVFWSDATQSELTDTLQQEWVDLIIWSDATRIDDSFDMLVYTEAVSQKQEEVATAIDLDISVFTYPEALANIVNKKKLIAVAWTHGKSTTTSLTSLVLKDSNIGVNTIVWTLLKEFDGKNTYFSESENFVIEACEYKRSFLKYKPTLGIITNIEIDHLDYYKDLDDYISAYEEFINNIVPGGFCILNGDDDNCRQLIWRRDDIAYIEIFQEAFVCKDKHFTYPNIDIKIPGQHILFDAKIAYVIGHMFWLWDEEILKKLSVYNGVWRRMEGIWETVYNNILMSDYWHHPTEISLTLESIRQKKNCFGQSDILVIPDIYESRDSEADKKSMNAEILLDNIDHPNKVFWDGLKNTADWISNYDKQNPDNSLIILLGAWNVDDLRFEIKMKK